MDAASTAGTTHRRRSPIHWLRNRSLPVLAALIVLLIVYPAFDHPGAPTPLAVTVLFAAVPLFGVCMLASTRWIIVTSIVAVASVASFFLVAGGNTEEALGGWPGLLTLAFYAVATGVIGRAVFVSKAVIDDRVYGGIAVYIMVGIMFAILFHRLGVGDPGAFAFDPAREHAGTLNWADYVYFSFTSLTTLGFGDITPISSRARNLSVIEGGFGMLYPAALLARLVAPQANGR